MSESRQVAAIRLLGFIAVLGGAVISYWLAQHGHEALAAAVASAVSWYVGKLTGEPAPVITVRALRSLPPLKLVKAIDSMPPTAAAEVRFRLSQRPPQ